MNLDEKIRESHRPDWLPVFFGVTCAFAAIGSTSIVGNALGLLRFYPTDSIPAITTKFFWILGSVMAALYVGSYAMGRVLPFRSRAAAAMDGLLVWEMTILLYALLGWLNISPLPSVFFDRNFARESNQGLFWIYMALLFIMPYPAAFGAMDGNRRARPSARGEARSAQEAGRAIDRKAA